MTESGLPVVSKSLMFGHRGRYWERVGDDGVVRRECRWDEGGEGVKEGSVNGGREVRGNVNGTKEKLSKGREMREYR